MAPTNGSHAIEQHMDTGTEFSPFRWLTRLALGLLLALVAARCLMLEVVREALSTTTFGPGPTTSVILDWLTIVPMLLILARRVFDAEYTLRFRWAHVAMAALAVWTLSSVSWAGDRWIALIGAMHIVAGASLFWSASQLVRRSEHLRVVAGVCVGLLLANFLHALLYRMIELPDSQTYFQQHKAEMLERMNLTPGDFAATRFEKKIMAGEMLGFNASPNTLGAVIVVLTLISVGAALQRLEDKDDQGWIGIMFIVALLGLYPLAYTGSKASYAALLLGLLLLGVWRVSRKWLSQHHTLVFSVIVGGFALAVVTLLAIGLSTGGLPEDSLNFRWRYWTAAWFSVTEHAFRGVGWANFGSAFLQNRLAISAEEIKDPHNFLVSWLSELGVVGLALGLCWLLAWFWSASRVQVPGPLQASRVPVKSVLWIAVPAFALSLFAVDWSQLSESDRYTAAVLESLRRFLLCGLVALGIGLLCVRDGEHREVDARPAPWLIAGVFVAVLMFLLQSLIDISFFQPGPFMLCVLALGTSMGIALTDGKPRRAALSIAGLTATSLAWIVLLFAVVVPVTLAENDASYARQLAQNQPQRAVELYRSAFDRAPVRNADYLSRAAESSQLIGVEANRQTRDLLNEAILADPTSVGAVLSRARFLIATSASDADIEVALNDYGRATILNPRELDLRIEYAALLERFGRREQAAAQLGAALEINDAYDPGEPERLELRRPGELERIREKIASLSGRPA